MTYHIDTLVTKRRTAYSPEERQTFCEKEFLALDGILYHVEKETPFVSISRENPIFQTAAALAAVREHGFYQPSAAEIEAVLTAADTVTLDMKTLRLDHSCHEEGWAFLRIPTAEVGYQSLNPHERTLAERLYGQSTNFTANMKFLREAGIKSTGIWLESPSIVLHEAPYVVPCSLDPLGPDEDATSTVTIHRSTEDYEEMFELRFAVYTERVANLGRR